MLKLRRGKLRKLVKREKKSPAMFAANVVARINKVTKSEDTAYLLSDDIVLSEIKEWISTGLHWFDRILTKSGKGFPIGRAFELYGKEATAKSALSLYISKKFIEAGGVVLYIDFETSVDHDHIKMYNFPENQFIYATPETADEAWDAVWAALDEAVASKCAYPTLIIWDSVAGTLPKEEKDEKTSGQSHMGLLARAFSKGCRKLPRRLAKSRASVIFVNQVREKIGVMFGDKTARPAGHALDFACSALLKMYRMKTLRTGSKKPAGYLIELETKKNRLAPPHNKAQFILSFKHGIDEAKSAFNEAKVHKLIRSAGTETKISLEDEEVSISTKSWRSFYADHRDVILSALDSVVDVSVDEGGDNDDGEENQEDHSDE